MVKRVGTGCPRRSARSSSELRWLHTVAAVFGAARSSNSRNDGSFSNARLAEAQCTVLRLCPSAPCATVPGIHFVPASGSGAVAGGGATGDTPPRIPFQAASSSAFRATGAKPNCKYNWIVAIRAALVCRYARSCPSSRNRWQIVDSTTLPSPRSETLAGSPSNARDPKSRSAGGPARSRTRAVGSTAVPLLV